MWRNMKFLHIWQVYDVENAFRGAFKIKKWEKLVFWTNQGGDGLTESQLFGKISQN